MAWSLIIGQTFVMHFYGSTLIFTTDILAYNSRHSHLHCNRLIQEEEYCTRQLVGKAIRMAPTPNAHGKYLFH